MKPPQEIIRKDLETLLRTLKEAITEARAAGATEVQIAGIVAAAEDMAAQQGSRSRPRLASRADQGSGRAERDAALELVPSRTGRTRCKSYCSLWPARAKLISFDNLCDGSSQVFPTFSRNRRRPRRRNTIKCQILPIRDRLLADGDCVGPG
jgi:hypothetical protein